MMSLLCIFNVMLRGLGGASRSVGFVLSVLRVSVMPLPILPLLHPVLSSRNSDNVSVLTLLAVDFLVSFILSVLSELHFL